MTFDALIYLGIILVYWVSVLVLLSWCYFILVTIWCVTGEGAILAVTMTSVVCATIPIVFVGCSNYIVTTVWECVDNQHQHITHHHIIILSRINKILALKYCLTDAGLRLENILIPETCCDSLIVEGMSNTEKICPYFRSVSKVSGGEFS